MPARSSTKLVVIGGGGHGREILDLIDDINAEADRGVPGIGHIEVVGVADDGTPDAAKLDTYNLAHLGPVDVVASLPPDVFHVIGIGSPAVRRTISNGLDPRRAAVLVHPTVLLGREVEIGPGSVICAHSSLTNHITLGQHVHVNRASTIGHDAVLGDFVTLSPRVAISGGAVLGNGAFLGTGAVVNPLVTIGDDAVIGSGAAVVRDVAANVTAVGVPARPR